MKRLILLSVIFLTGFTLSGCDLIPSDVVDTLTEDLCREDPNNELCAIDDLSNVAEDVAEGLVTDAIDVLNDGNADVCDTVFSITNTDLLDACKDGTLLPQGVTEFTVITAEQEGDVYIFKGSTGDAFHEVRVTYGEVEGAMRITSMSITEIEDPTPVTELTDEEFIRAFFADYVDSNIDFNTFFATYLSGNTQGIFEADDRDEDLTNGFTVTVDAITMLDAGKYEVTYTYSVGTETETLTLVYLILDNEGTRYIELDLDGDTGNNEETALTVAEFETLFNQFIADYLNPDITDQQLTETWFDSTDEDFNQGRQANITAGTTITFVSATSVGDNVFEVTVEFNDGTSTETDTTKISVYDDNGRTVLVFDGVDDDCDGTVDECNPDDLVTGADAELILEQYFMDYIDDTITNQEFADTYFEGYLDPEFAALRTDELARGVTFDIKSVTHFEDGSFIVEYTLFEGEDMVLRKRPGRIRQRPDLLVVEWDALIDEQVETDPVFVTSFFTAFVADYLDADVTDAELQTSYFGDQDMAWFYEQRANDLIDGINIQVDMVEPYDDFGIFTVKLTITSGTESFQEDIKIKIRRIDAATPVLYFLDDDDDGDGIPVADETEALQILTDFVNDYNNAAITDEDLKMMYGLYESFFVLDQRRLDMESGVTLTLGMLTPKSEWGEGVYEVTFYANSNDAPEETRVTAVLVVRYADQTMLYFDSDDDGDGIPIVDEAIADQLLRDFVADYNDPAVSDDQLMMTYGLYDSYFIIDQRIKDMQAGVTLSLSMFTPMFEYGDGVYEVTLLANSNDAPEETRVTAVILVTYQDSSMIIFEDPNQDGTPVVDPLEAEQLLRDFVADYNDPLKTNDDLAMKWGLYDGGYPFLNDRQMDQDMGVTLTFGMLEPALELGDGAYHVTFYANQPDQPEQTRVTAVLIVRYADQTMLAFGPGNGIDNDCDYVGDICEVVTDPAVAQGYMEAFLAMYNDPTVSIDMLYPYVIEYLSLFDMRDMDLADGIAWSVASVEDLGDNVFLFRLEHLHTEGVVHRDIAVRMYHRGSMAMLREVFVPELFYETDLTVITSFLTDLFAALNDSTMTNDMINDMYFGGMAPESFFEYRGGGGGGGRIYILNSIEQPQPIGSPDVLDAMFILNFDVDVDGVLHNYTYDVYFWKHEGGLWMEVMMPYVGDMELEIFVYNFVEMISSPDTPLDLVCEDFTTTSDPLCTAIFNYHRDNGYYAYVDRLDYQDDGSYLAVIVTVDDLGEMVETNTFIFRHSADNPLYEAETTTGNNPLYEN